MDNYLADRWKPVLEANGLADFDAIWNLDIGWFEPKNERRGGWSGVSRLSVRLPDGSGAGVFVKRQENHVFRSWRRPLRGEATLVREMKNLLRCRRLGIPVYEPIFFMQHDAGGGKRAILLTQELTGYHSLAELTDQWRESGWPARPERVRIIEEVAKTVALLHCHHLQHNCLFPKHIFIRQQSTNEVEVRLIDLEKLKWRPLFQAAVLRDLDTLNRHAHGWRATDRLRFLKYYVAHSRQRLQVDDLWRRLRRRFALKFRQSSE